MDEELQELCATPMSYSKGHARLLYLSRKPDMTPEALQTTYRASSNSKTSPSVVSRQDKIRGSRDGKPARTVIPESYM
jgi:hypothetical protein